MRFSLALLILIAFCAPLFAVNPAGDDPFEKVKDANSFIAAVIKSRDRAVADLYEERERVRIDIDSEKERSDKINLINGKIAEINDPYKIFIPADDSSRFFILGPDERRLRLLKKIDALNSLVEFQPTASTAGVREIVLTGTPTGEWPKDSPVSLVGLFIQIGEKEVDDAKGTKTVAVMKRVDFTPHQSERLKSNNVRTWHLPNGRKLVGAMLFYESGNVDIEPRPSAREQVSLESLSFSDREYVAAHSPAPKPHAAAH